MSKIRTRIWAGLGALALALTAAFVAVPAGTANAADCRDGVTLWNY